MGKTCIFKQPGFRYLVSSKVMLSNASITQMRDCWEPWNLHRFSESCEPDFMSTHGHSFRPLWWSIWNNQFDGISAASSMNPYIFIHGHFGTLSKILVLDSFCRQCNPWPSHEIGWFVFAPGFAFRGVKKTPPSVALRFRWGVSTENHHRRYCWWKKSCTTWNV